MIHQSKNSNNFPNEIANDNENDDYKIKLMVNKQMQFITLQIGID